MPDHLGDDMRKVKGDEKEKEEAEIKGRNGKVGKFVKSSSYKNFPSLLLQISMRETLSC